jgi:hypothetical protein
MNFILVIFSFFSFTLYAQKKLNSFNSHNSLSHFNIQVKTDSISRDFAVNQIYNFFENKLNQTVEIPIEDHRMEILVPLNLKNMKDNVAENIKRIAGVTLKSEVDYSLVKKIIAENRKSMDTLYSDSINKASGLLINIKPVKFSYEIPLNDSLKPSQSIRIERVPVDFSNDEFNVEMLFSLRNFRVSADHVEFCISPFELVGEKLSILKCSHLSNTLKQFEEFLVQFENGEAEIIEVSVIDKASSALTDISLKLENANLSIRDVAPLNFSFKFKIIQLESGNLKMTASEESQFIGLDEQALNQSIKFSLGDDSVANEDFRIDFFGLDSISIGGNTISVTSEGLENNFRKRVDYLKKIILKPLEGILSSEFNKFMTSEKNGKENYFNGVELKDFKFGDKINFSANFVNFFTVNDGEELLSIGTGVDLSLKGAKESSRSDLITDKDIHLKLASYLADEVEGKSADIAVSLDNTLFNDLITDFLNKNETQEKTGFKVHDLDFIIGQTAVVPSSGKDYDAYIQGCISFMPKKGLAKTAVQIVGDKQNGVFINFLGYLKLDVNSTGNGPELSANLFEIQNDKDYLSSKATGCNPSKIFPKLVSSIESKLIDKNFNRIELIDLPLFKLQLPALADLGANFLKLHSDMNLNQIDILFSLEDVEHLDNSILEKFKTLKPIISFPKIEMMKELDIIKEE